MTTVALAGRLIDQPDAAHPRFPLDNVSMVKERLADYFRQKEVQHLVSSAACGADLLALKVAAEAGIARTVVLPFEVDAFRETSVISRPGSWAELYDHVVNEARATRELIVLDRDSNDDSAYEAATQRIIDVAAHLGGVVRACIVWEGASRGSGDHSMSLAEAGGARRWPVDEVPTL